ncbi:hypothetical protein [Streptomyces bauhiniae]
MWLALPFALVAVAALVGLALVDVRTVPPVTATTAAILTMAALAVATFR